MAKKSKAPMIIAGVVIVSILVIITYLGGYIPTDNVPYALNRVKYGKFLGCDDFENNFKIINDVVDIETASINQTYNVLVNLSFDELNAKTKLHCNYSLTRPSEDSDGSLESSLLQDGSDVLISGTSYSSIPYTNL
tara:strand:- start:1398 stop:1805 length:408 start_codon:yes stop_codon:yes gene_type:complete